MKAKITAVAALRMAYLKKTPDSNNRNAPSARSASNIRAAYKLPLRYGTDTSPAWV